MENILTFLAFTPKYVYLILFYLLYVGLKATKARTVSIYKSILITTIFAGISMDMLLKIVNVNFEVSAAWILSFGMGIGLGWLQVNRIEIKVDKIKKLLFLPGTWTTLCVILCIFSFKYYIGYKQFHNPHIMEDFFFQISAFSVSGGSLGILVGRLMNYLYRLKKAEHTDLAS